ncbi:MAG: hypothetical protein R3E03_01560 [Novosphingobium sp.]
MPDEQLAVVGDLVVAPVPFFDTAERLEGSAGSDFGGGSEGADPGHGAPMN